MKGLLYENKIIQIETKDFPVHPSLTWIDLNNYPEVVIGSVFNAVLNRFDPPAPRVKPVDEKAVAIAAVTQSVAEVSTKAEKITTLSEASTKYGLGMITKEELQQVYDDFKTVTPAAVK